MTVDELSQMFVWFWDQMIFLYGGNWERTYGRITGNEAKAWKKLLAGMTKDQIRTGVKRTERRDSEFPPTRQAFKRTGCERQHLEHRPYVAQLPSSTWQERKAAAAAGLAKAREILGGVKRCDSTTE